MGLPMEALIAIIGILAMVIIGILSWPRMQDRLFGKHPDTYVCCYGMEYSYTISQLKAEAPVRSRIRLQPIKVPEGFSGDFGSEVPLKLFDWTYSQGEKLYTITAHNKGDGIARNTQVDIDFTPNSIRFVKINNQERVKLIRGGKPTSSRAVFKIAELLPDEVQDVEILISGKNIKSFNAWSENQGDINNVFVFDIFIEPDKGFLS